MKLLIILLFTFNTYADVRVSVTPLNGNAKNPIPQDFKSQDKLDIWVADMINDDSWGKKERWEKYTDQTICLEFRDIKDDEEIIIGQECKMPVEYTVVQTDITSELLEAKTKKDAKDKKVKDFETKLKIEDLDLVEINEYLRSIK